MRRIDRVELVHQSDSRCITLGMAGGNPLDGILE
jgi:hypothetical protein